MCYGSIDPKHQARDIEARVKSVSWTTDTRKEMAPDARGGVMTLIRVFWTRIRRKDLRRV